MSPIPARRGSPPAVHRGMPHTQIGVEPVPEVNAELHRRAFALPGVSAIGRHIIASERGIDIVRFVGPAIFVATFTALLWALYL